MTTLARSSMALVLLSGLAISSVSSAASSDPRGLPSLVVRWERNVENDSAVLANDVLYVQGNGRVMALDPRDGSVLWESVCSSEPSRSSVHLLVLHDTVVTAANRLVCLVDRHTGAIRRRIDLKGSLFRIVGPPLVADIIPDDVPSFGAAFHHHIVRVDHRTGDVLARHDMKGMLLDLLTADGIVVASVEPLITNPRTGHSDLEKMRRSPRSVIGFRADDLGVLWTQRLRPTGSIVVRDGRLHVPLDSRGSTSAGLVALDPATGTPAPALQIGARHEVQQGPATSRGLPGRLRRLHVETGNVVWDTGMPATPFAWTRTGDRLLVHCGGFPGRGYLVVLDWNSGAELTVAYGLRGIRSLEIFQDTLIARSNEALLGLSADSFGPPERASRSVKSEVERIFRNVPAARASSSSSEAAIVDLKALGPEALPHVSDLIPALPPPALAIAARALGEAQFGAAAPLLAERLRTLPFPSSADAAVLHSLSRLGGAPEVAAVASVFTDPSRDGTIRRLAFAALASIGSPDAARVIDEALKRQTSTKTDDTSFRRKHSLPKAVLPPAKGEEQEIVQAIFQQVFMFPDDIVFSGELAVAVSDFEVKWPDGTGPATTLREADVTRFRKHAAMKYVLISVRPAGTGPGEQGRERTLGPGERRYDLTLDRGPLAGVGYRVIMRKLGPRWVMKDFSEIWVS